MVMNERDLVGETVWFDSEASEQLNWLAPCDDKGVRTRTLCGVTGRVELTRQLVPNCTTSSEGSPSQQPEANARYRGACAVRSAVVIRARTPRLLIDLVSPARPSHSPVPYLTEPRASSSPRFPKHLLTKDQKNTHRERKVPCHQEHGEPELKRIVHVVVVDDDSRA